jgi:Sec-independent protein translocase protein TatA
MFANIGPVQLLIVLLIGSDLGSAVKGFRSAVSEADKETPEQIDDQSNDASFDSTPVDEPSKENQS